MVEPAAIRYEVRAPNPNDHRAEVTVVVGKLTGVPFDVVFPSWVPGSYWIQDRVRNVSSMSARPTGQTDPLPVTRLEKARWRVDPASHTSVDLHYNVYGNDLRVALPDVTPEHLFLGTGFALPYIEGRRNEPLDLRIEVPSDWTVHTELAEVSQHPPTFRASDYDELVDSPVDAGRAESFVIHPAGVPHRIVVCGAGGTFDAERLRRDVAQVVEATVRLFGESPVPSYTFYYHGTETPWNGLEHARSNHSLLPVSGFGTPTQYRHFLRLTSHEYLHLYNVKRIHPAAFDPFDYTRETYTRLLWAMEGTTDYLSWLVLLRSGLISPERSLSDLAEQIRRYRDTPGRLHQSLEDASVAAWVDFYHPDEETPNRSVSYYLKGELVSLCLDLELRSRTAAASSLEAVWRELWRSYGAVRKGLGEAELPAIVERVTGVNVDEFFADYVAGTKEVEFERFFGSAGLTLRPRVAPRKPDDDPEASYLGVEFENAGGIARIRTVREGSPARRGGLSPRDEIVALDGGRAPFDEWPKLLERYRPGTRVEFTVFRRGRLRTVPVVVGESPPKELELLPEPESSAGAQKVYESWLGVPWTPPKPPTAEPG